MTVINTNVGALTARTFSIKANESMQKSMERLSSGLRINSAADDAAGLAVANKMESQLRGMNVAIRNSQDGISLVQTAEAGMGEISNMVIRMRELAVQMNNGVYTSADRSNAQLEVTALLAEIDKIASNTAFSLQIAKIAGRRFIVELDEYPPTVPARPIESGMIPPGMAMVSFMVTSLDSLPVSWRNAPIAISDLGYAGQRAAVTEGAAGEWVSHDDQAGPARQVHPHAPGHGQDRAGT